MDATGPEYLTQGLYRTRGAVLAVQLTSELNKLEDAHSSLSPLV